LPKIWIAWVGCTNVTDDRRQTTDRRQTDGRWHITANVNVCEDRSISFVVERGLHNPNVGTAASVALLNLCVACAEELSNQYESLIAHCLPTLKLPQYDGEFSTNVLKGASCNLRYDHLILLQFSSTWRCHALVYSDSWLLIK